MRGWRRLIGWLVAGGGIVVAALAIFLNSDFARQDDCLDAGGAWRDGACEGRRPGE